MEFEFIDKHIGVLLQISENGEIIAECYLQVKKEHAEKLCGGSYQITKKPEPVYIVQIPETCKTVDAWIVAELREKNLNGLPIGEDFTGNNRSGNYSFSDIPDYCLKQKQPEPTVEELQRRLDKIERFATEQSTIRDADYAEIKKMLSGK